MTKKTEGTDTPKTRTRRASIPISEGAKVEIHHVSDAFGLPLAQVRDEAGAIASEAIISGLRGRLGSARVEAARLELERLEREVGGAGSVAEEVVPE